MKPFFLIGAAAAVIGIAAFLLLSKKDDLTGSPAPVAFVGPRPTTTLTDPIEVFQRAFWKRPSSTDRILHAERREWAGEQGVKRWQWFIVVEPSPELVRHLYQDNAFGMIPAQTLAEIENAPMWFTPRASEGEILKLPRGNLQLLLDQKKTLLYATDTGGGFAAGAPELPKEMPPAAPPSGRLPTTPPPR